VLKTLSTRLLFHERIRTRRHCDEGGVRAVESGTLGLDSKEYDVELSLRATSDSVPILPGGPSEVWRYKAELLKGPEDTVSENADSYLIQK
jgi:hypothetical protein